VAEYAPLVDSVISERSLDVQHIGRLLDGLLDFCFDPASLLLYKKLCRHYYAIDPAAAAGTHQHSVYIPLAAHEQLRKLPFDERGKMHDYLLEGLDLVFRQKGLPSIAELTARGRA
jgi:hypothetical protein